MGVKPALQLFSPALTEPLSFMKDHAGHTCDAKFADAGPTVEFMQNMCRWVTLMDVSNCQQHIHQNHPDTKEFYDPEDSRLHWLALVFLEYIEDLKATSAPQNFLTKETHHALVFTTVSNVQCIRFLLHRGFKFVLTRKFSSDPIESLFGTLRRSAGCNDMLDVRSALSGLEKMLKTGIVAASSTTNVHSSSSFFSSGNIIVSGNPSSMSSTSAAASSKRCAAATVNSAQQQLRELCTSTKPFLPTPDMAAISLVAGYISRVVTEKIECGRCVSLVTKAKGSCTGALDGLIAHQGRGGLCYPTPELVAKYLLSRLPFGNQVLKDLKSLHPSAVKEESAIVALRNLAQQVPEVVPPQEVSALMDELTLLSTEEFSSNPHECLDDAWQHVFILLSSRYGQDASAVPLKPDMIKAVKGSFKKYQECVSAQCEPSAKKAKLHQDPVGTKVDEQRSIQMDIDSAKKMLANAELLIAKGMKAKKFDDIESGQALLKEGQAKLASSLSKLEDSKKKKGCARL
ncbi:hypothetical protein HPB50_029459 [Hyalomma asiaticum]|nr:hypothetical protein HPB50_029459 [Hyalomma asiaticum]